jgi:hypothetical protein
MSNVSGAHLIKDRSIRWPHVVNSLSELQSISFYGRSPFTFVLQGSADGAIKAESEAGMHRKMLSSGRMTQEKGP